METPFETSYRRWRERPKKKTKDVQTEVKGEGNIFQHLLTEIVLQIVSAAAENSAEDDVLFNFVSVFFFMIWT